MDKLFVYGSLMPNNKNFFILKNIFGCWQKAFTFGFVRKIKLEKDIEYDAIISDSKGKKINGYLLTSYILKNIWKKIDYFEGQHYFRTKTDVYLKNKKKTEAHIYCLQIPKVKLKRHFV
jgi:gamma-glutamylcyclotransferase (GGCT)/AIG2-like uncharacterized protein YtfP